MENGEHNGDANGVVIDVKDEFTNGDNNGNLPYQKKSKGSDPDIDIKDGKKKEKNKENEEKIGYIKLFRYANSLDYICMVIGTIAAMVHGAAMPALFIIFGDITDPFVEFGKLANNPNFTGCISDIGNGSSSTAPMPLDINYFIMWFCIIAAITWVSGTIQMHLWMLVAVRLGHRIKMKFLRSILRQDMTYFDLNSMGEMNTRLADDVQKVQDGIGDKLAVFICMLARCIAGIIIGFIYAWQLTLVILAVTPLMAVSAGLLMRIATAFTKRELDVYAKAGAIAEEVLSSMRTVVAFGGEEKEIARYKVHLKEATKFGITKGVAAGGSLGFVMFVLFSVYGLSFWYGSTLVLDYDPPRLSVGGLLTCFFAVFIAAFSLGQGLSQMEYFSIAMGAGYKVFTLIDRVPPIDSFSTSGHKPDVCTGKVEFRNVNFTYPSREDVQVLKDVSIVAETGKTIALCGQSGCGKSTCVQLIQRFYDPQAGEILLDGHDIRTLNVKWLRENIGVVSQEPVLFDDTIIENIRYGRDAVSDEEVHQAAKEANAYDFIMKLPQKFETLVGEGGTQMSGGQKQRIAIARAIVRNPKVLLLDEATSALDTESESIVQVALEKASEGRTTIVIAHRLSTIRDADIIVGFNEGQVLEQGSHNELLELDSGVYKNLVEMQNVKHTEDDTDVVKEEIVSKRSSSKKTSTKRKRVLSTSSTVKDDEKGSENEDDDDLPEVSWFRVMKLNTPEMPYIIFGTFMSLISGGIQPTYAIMFANFLGAFAILDPVQQKEDIRLYCLLFFGLGCIILVSNLAQAACFAKSGESLTERIRGMCFRHLMKQEMTYFDDNSNSTGALTTRLAVDASRIQGMAGIRLGLTAANIGALAVGLGIAFAYSWKITLLMIAFLPFMVLGGYLQMQMFTGKGTAETKSFEKSGQIATEATMSIKTVASLTKEEKFLQRYADALEIPYGKMKKKAFLYGLSFGYSQSVLNFAFAGVFRFGAYLVETDCLPFVDMFKVLMAVMMASMIAGQSSSMAPDYAAAMLSSRRVFKLLDRKSAIDSSSEEGDKPAFYDGRVTLNSCKFTYPSRPDIKVLKGLSVAVNPGETLALVGQSGCGKSTVIQLILRYYDPNDGQVLMDNAVNTSTNIKWMRQQLGIVAQEPVLFDTSIADNIRYGDNTREVSDDEIISAAKSANIHDFIDTLPDKYETNVGGKGTQLSGGQKQRVAIARALVRKPKVLLLDEATSALDTESEKIVQAALDAAQEGRTCIVIAHRLSTVKNADNIAVIENGAVVEFGKHTELLNKRGIYYNLVNAQLNRH